MLTNYQAATDKLEKYPEILRTDHLAELLEVTKSGLRQRIYRGEEGVSLPPRACWVKDGCKRVRRNEWLKADVRQWLERRSYYAQRENSEAEKVK